MKINSVMVVGADGLIGRALRSFFCVNNCHVTGTSRREGLPVGWVSLDLARGADNFFPLIEPPQVVFICAAITGFAACAQDPEYSRLVNVTRTVEVGRHFMREGSMVVFLSSNAVFDGTLGGLDESATTSPVTEYGRQKAECENALLLVAKELRQVCAVVRLTKVVDREQPLIARWLQSFESQMPAKAATDLVMSPLTVGYVVNGLKTIAEGAQGGVFHLTGEADVTYFELAQEMASSFKRGTTVEPEFVQARLGAVPAPKHSALSMAETSRSLGLQPQTLSEVACELLETS